MSRIPEDYSKPSTKGKYMKFAQWENKFRILSDLVTGYEDWKEEDGKKRPVRTKIEKAPLGEDRVKHFRSMVVYNYGDEAIQILNITQSSIQEAIYSYAQDEDWGSPDQYDIIITRQGEKLETKYLVTPKPKKELDKEIVALHKATPVNLEALFSGWDPFIKTEEVKEVDDEMF